MACTLEMINQVLSFFMIEGIQKGCVLLDKILYWYYVEISKLEPKYLVPQCAIFTPTEVVNFVLSWCTGQDLVT